MLKFCDKCGSSVNPDDAYCNNCGNALAKSTTWIEPSKPIRGSHQQRTEIQKPSYSTSQPRKLYRSREERWIAGVCGGLGEYFNVDPVLIRIAFILFSLAYGSGLLVYILCAIFIEENPHQQPRSNY